VTFPGLGGQQPPPQNSTPALQPVPGIQAGTSGQVVARRVIIIGTMGELLVYSPTAAAGNLVASIAGGAGTDSYGNTYLEGITSYVITGGQTYAIQIGSETVAGSTFPALFMTNLTSPPYQPPLIYGLTPSASGSGIELNSGIGSLGGVASGVIAQDSASSGVPSGAVDVVAGELLFNGSVIFDGTNFYLPSGGALYIGGVQAITATNFNMNPPMGNTNVLATLVAEMTNRGMIS
jgi:hypothetical protein